MDFYSAISRYYNYIFPLNSLHLNFISNSLPPGSAILEVGSATGNLTRALAEKGYRVVGIDLEKNMVKRAEEENLFPGLKYYQMDMLKIDEAFKRDEFCGIVCLGNTLVHLPSREKVGCFLGKAKKNLAPKGLIFIQIVNYDRVLKKKIKQLPEIENEKIKFQRFYEFSPSKSHVLFKTRLLVKDENKMYEQKVKLLALKKEELDYLLKQAGFSQIEFFGDFKMNPHNEESPATVVRATSEK